MELKNLPIHVLAGGSERVINDHLKNISTHFELEENTVIRNFRITAKARAISEFEKYRIVQDRLYQSDFDKQITSLESLEKTLKISGCSDE